MWELLAIQIGVALAIKFLFSDKDSTKLENDILKATNKEEVLVAVLGPVVADLVGRAEMDGITGEVIDKLAKINDLNDLGQVVSEFKIKLGLLDTISGLIGGLLDRKPEPVKEVAIKCSHIWGLQTSRELRRCSVCGLLDDGDIGKSQCKGKQINVDVSAATGGIGYLPDQIAEDD